MESYLFWLLAGLFGLGILTSLLQRPSTPPQIIVVHQDPETLRGSGGFMLTVVIMLILVLLYFSM